MDLEHQLQCNFNEIHERYASFVYCLCECLKQKEITVKQLRTFILRLPPQCGLSGIKARLEAADSLNAIFDLIGDECASFFHYDIFQSMKKEFCTASDCENPKLMYSEHFKKYVELHKISKFLCINSNLKTKYTDASKELTFKIDNIRMCDKLGKIVALRQAIATILNVKPSALRLVGIEEGCMVVTFLTPTAVAECIFFAYGNMLKISEKQKQDFQSLSVLWLKYGSFEFDFTLTEDVVSESSPSSESL